MDSGLARGYTNTWLRTLPKASEVCPVDKNLERACMAALMKVPTEKNRERAHKTAQPLVFSKGKVFSPLWTKKKATLLGFGLLHMDVGRFFNHDDREHALENEPAVAMRRIECSRDEDKLAFDPRYMTSFLYFQNPSLSRHCIQRLLERKGTTPDSMEKDIFSALLRMHILIGYATVLRLINEDQANGTLYLPYQDGALACTSVVAHHPGRREKDTYHISARTFLDANKLTDAIRESTQAWRDLWAPYAVKDLVCCSYMHETLPAKGPSADAFRRVYMEQLQDRRIPFETFA
jgi:hypothetical protein